MKTEICDVAVIGAGAAGLAAAAVTAAAGKRTLVIDREEHAGGILRQCIHNGFGLHCFKEELTGPEYADRALVQAELAGAEFLCGCTVTDVEKQEDASFRLTLLSGRDGVRSVLAKAVFLAMGCRERSRGNIVTPGTRPAGVFTAGAAQKLLNREGILPGKSAVIVGSGDIGLIMARRLRWCGIDVKAVVEIMPYPSGLTRNVVQCLHDFNIPLYLAHSVVNICGKDRVSGVDVAPLDAERQPDMDRVFHIDCDTVLFSVGLIPETELAADAGVKLDPATGGAVVDANYETSVPGIFSAGNVLHVHDLADYVTRESERAAAGILHRLNGGKRSDSIAVRAGENLKYAVPARTGVCDTVFSFRPLIVGEKCVLTAEAGGKVLWKKHLPFVRPAEMICVELAEQVLAEAEKENAELNFHLRRGPESASC